MSSRPDVWRVFSIISRIATGFDMSAGEKVTRTLKSAAIFAMFMTTLPVEGNVPALFPSICRRKACNTNAYWLLI
jgi:hypothetical protein